MCDWIVQEYYSETTKTASFLINEAESGQNVGCAEISYSGGLSLFNDKPPKNPEWFFNRLYIKPSFRKKGAGTTLLSYIKEFVYKEDICLHCEVNPYNDGIILEGLKRSELIKFYKKHGFKEKTFISVFFKKPFKSLFMNLKI